MLLVWSSSLKGQQLSLPAFCVGRIVVTFCGICCAGHINAAHRSDLHTLWYNSLSLTLYARLKIIAVICAPENQEDVSMGKISTAGFDSMLTFALIIVLQYVQSCPEHSHFGTSL